MATSGWASGWLNDNGPVVCVVHEVNGDGAAFQAGKFGPEAVAIFNGLKWVAADVPPDTKSDQSSSSVVTGAGFSC